MFRLISSASTGQQWWKKLSKSIREKKIHGPLDSPSSHEKFAQVLCDVEGHLHIIIYGVSNRVLRGA